MMDLSKTLQEDIRVNQINLKAAIQNHQALVVKLRGGNLADTSEVKLKLAGIQKHILSLGEAQKVLVARVKKELAANSNSWSNHTSDRSERPNAELRVYPPSANCLDPARKFNSTNQKRGIRPVKSEHGDEDGDRKRSLDGGCDPPSKRVKTILHSSSRPTSPVLSNHNYDQGALPSSSDDSQESMTIDTSSEPSKVDFLSAVGLINKEQLMLTKSNNMRRRRRHAGHHSQYSSQSHWDLTVRRHRPRCGEQDKEQQPPVSRGSDVSDPTPMPTPIPGRPMSVREESGCSPAASPAIVEIKRENESSSSGSGSSSPSQDVPAKDHTSSPDKIVCTVCRKKGILSVCDICSTAFHWFCLEKGKQCPVCLVSQVGDSLPTPFRHLHRNHGGGHGGHTDATVNKVMGQTMGGVGSQGSKPPNHVTSDEVFTRYYKRVAPVNANESNNYAESNGKHKKINSWRREDQRENQENSRHN